MRRRLGPTDEPRDGVTGHHDRRCHAAVFEKVELLARRIRDDAQMPRGGIFLEDRADRLVKASCSARPSQNEPMFNL
jgi:hypothetical protein